MIQKLKLARFRKVSSLLKGADKPWVF